MVSSPVNQSTDQSIQQSINQSIDTVETVTIHSYDIDTPTNQSINQNVLSPTSTTHLTNQPINQSHKQSIRPTNEPTNQSTNQSTSQSTNQSINPYWPPRLFQEARSRLPYYLSDVTDAYHRKTLSSAFFVLFVSIAPSLTFGEYLLRQTNQSMGVTEVLFSCALGSIAYALLSGQPLTIVGVSGPIVILARTLYQISLTYEIDFLVWFAWANIWAALMHWLMCMINGSSALVGWLTRFSEDVFGMLISVIFIVNTIQDLVDFFTSSTLLIDAQYFCFILTIGVSLLALTLHHANQWSIFNRQIRELIVDYAMVLSCLFWCFITYLPHFSSTRDTLPFLTVSGRYVPTSLIGRSHQSWGVDLGSIPAWAIFAAILPGLLITALFWFDHCVSKLSCEAAHFGLKKPTNTFNWDFALLGAITLMLGLMGLPPVNGIIPQCALHAKALMITETVKESHIDQQNVLLTEQENETTNQSVNQSNNQSIDPINQPIRRRRVSISTRSTKVKTILQRHGVIEQRVSNLLQGIFTAVVLCFPSVLSLIPRAVLSGVFLFMGCTGLAENQLWHRIWLIITDEILAEDQFTKVALEHQAKRNINNNQQTINQSIDRVSRRGLKSWLCHHQISPHAKSITYCTIYLFTFVQFLCFGVVYGITWTEAGVAFPLFILLLIPMRRYALPKIFSEKQLEFLDNSDAEPTWPDSEEDINQSTYIDQHRHVHHVQTRSTHHHHDHKEEIIDV